MTVEENDTIERFVISGTGPYPFSFRIYEDSDIAATALESGDVDPVTLTLNTDYTVTGANDEDGGTVTLSSGAASSYSGYTLDMRSNTPLEQPTSIKNQGTFAPVVHEKALDRLSRQIQDVYRQLKQAWRYPDNVNLDAKMTSRSAWLGKWPYVNEDGEIEPSVLSGQAMTQSTISELLYPQTAAEIAAGVTPVDYSIPSYKSLTFVNLFRNLTDAEIAGTGDVTDKINWAIQVAKNSGCYEVRLPACSLQVSGEISIDASGLKITGPGPERCTITQTASNTSCITTPTSINRLLWVQLGGFKIVMPDASTGHGIHIRNPESFKGKWLRVTTAPAEETAGYGILIERESDSDYGYYACLEHCHIDKQGTGVAIVGASPGNANAHWLSRVISNNNANYGFYILNNTGTYIRSCAGEQNTHNVYIEGGYGVQVESGRYERPDTHNVYVHSGEGHLVERALLASSGNVNTSTGRAVYVDAATFTRITNNNIQDGFSTYDIEVTSNAVDTVILDNATRDNSNGWSNGGTQVSDAGTRTIFRDLHVTSGGTARAYHKVRTLIDSGNLQVGSNGPTIFYSGTGTPEGSLSAGVGAWYFRENGSAGLRLYRKDTGTGNTGWTAVL